MRSGPHLSRSPTIKRKAAYSASSLSVPQESIPIGYYAASAVPPGELGPPSLLLCRTRALQELLISARWSLIGCCASSTGRIDQHGQSLGGGHHFTQQFQPLCRQFSHRKLIPVRLPPGRARLATSPSFTGSCAMPKTMGIVADVSLAANAAGGDAVAITATRRRTRSASGRAVLSGIHM